MTELGEIISNNEERIGASWIQNMVKSIQPADLISKTELKEQCSSILSAMVTGIKVSGPKIQRTGRKVVHAASAPMSPIAGLFSNREE
jgi:hypothetical protein